MMPEEDAVNAILKPIIGPWYESLENPKKTQEIVLYGLLKKYTTTDYGKMHSADQISGVSEFQARFPIVDYKALSPCLTQVKESNYKALLPEPPECWLMPHGSTGHVKVLPATQTNLKQIFTCVARALVNLR